MVPLESAKAGMNKVILLSAPTPYIYRGITLLLVSVVFIYKLILDA
jgi:hypothetical protein